MDELTVEQRLGLDAFETDEQSHIKVNRDRCKERDVKVLLRICPARCFTVTSGELIFSRLGCLECGACRAAASPGAIEWSFPRGGTGVHYRFG